MALISSSVHCLDSQEAEGQIQLCTNEVIESFDNHDVGAMLVTLRLK